MPAAITSLTALKVVAYLAAGLHVSAWVYVTGAARRQPLLRGANGDSDAPDARLAPQLAMQPSARQRRTRRQLQHSAQIKRECAARAAEARILAGNAEAAQSAPEKQ